jgi:hypothetical protein
MKMATTDDTDSTDLIRVIGAIPAAAGTMKMASTSRK